MYVHFLRRPSRCVFEWHEEKNRSNLIKHGLDFEPAALVFADPLAISQLDRLVDNEQRWQITGSAGGMAVIVVAYTIMEENNEEVVRIISARRASPQERKAYAEANEENG